MTFLKVSQAIESFQNGEIIVVPTDTVYGIACDSVNDEAIQKIRLIKGRPDEKPLILLISSIDMLDQLTDDFSARHRILAEKFWPGALTLVFKKKEGISDLITSGGNKIGVRIPAEKNTLLVISALGRPIVATSVNRSGLPSLKTSEEIAQEFPDLPILESAGESKKLESTVLDLTEQIPKILRQGVVSKIELEEVLGQPID